MATVRLPSAYEEGMMCQRRIVGAIKARDARAAGQAMNDHMEQISRFLACIGDVS
jgi:DNA-binding FadR family transcriptional regulator